MIGRQAASRNHAVHVGMQRQILSPGVEDAEKTDLGSQVLCIGSEFEHCFPAGTEQQVVEHLGVPLAKCVEFVRQRKDHMKVGDAQQFLFSRGEPALTRLGLALGAVPVSTGVIGDGLMTAARTSIHVTAERCGAATVQRPENGQLLVAQPGSVSFDESVTLRAEYVRHFHARTAHADCGLHNFLDRWSRCVPDT